MVVVDHRNVRREALKLISVSRQIASEPRDAAKTSEDRHPHLSNCPSVLWSNNVRFTVYAQFDYYPESVSMLQSPSQGMSAPTGGGWAQLRQQTRALEGQVHAFSF